MNIFKRIFFRLSIFKTLHCKPLLGAKLLNNEIFIYKLGVIRYKTIFIYDKLGNNINSIHVKSRIEAVNYFIKDIILTY